ncbi:hypothetical protein RJ640_024843 [Escallonia rubra]|nr:hypothetical protein RJ640_024843 [Escallonia rubra]
MNKDAVLQAAEKAKEAGSTRFCMGAAWRDTIGRKTNFNQILEYVKEIRGMGMEVCCTLGMIEKQQALALKEAGLTAYNHNLDTSREYYPNVITTRTYDDRLETLKHVREAGINVCSASRNMGDDSDDCHSPYCDAKSHGQAICWQSKILRTGASTMLSSWRKFHLHWRQTVDNSQ